MKVRLWTLGSFEHRVIPGKQSIEKLRQLISNLTYGEDGYADVVWGPDLMVTVVEVDENLNDVIETPTVDDGRIRILVEKKEVE